MRHYIAHIFGLKKHILLIVVAIGCLSFFGDKTLSYIRNTVLSVTRYAYAAIDSFERAIDFRLVFDAIEKNAVLQAENKLLKDNLSMLSQLYHENAQLRSLQQFSIKGAKKVASSRLVATYADSSIESGIILVGSGQGVEVDQTVVDNEGLVGRISVVGKDTAQVIFLTSPLFKVPIIFPRTNEQAVAVGNHSAMDVLYLKRDSQVEVGDLAITSGEGEVFPYGVNVGRVSGVDRGRVEITPFVLGYKSRLVNIIIPSF